MPGVAIAGIGQVEFSKNIGRSERQIALEAIRLALADAGLLPSQVDGLVRFDMESTSEVEIARNLGIPNLRFFGEVGYGGGGGCAAVGHAAMAIETGLAETVVCWRARNRGSGGRPWAGTGAEVGGPSAWCGRSTRSRCWHAGTCSSMAPPASSWARSRSPSASTPRAIPTR
jgi:acetyl-CoA acetyltransferase